MLALLPNSVQSEQGTGRIRPLGTEVVPSGGPALADKPKLFSRVDEHAQGALRNRPCAVEAGADACAMIVFPRSTHLTLSLRFLN